MKRNFILLLCLFSALGVFAQEYKDWSKWSITLEGGLNRLDGDVRQSYNDVIPKSLNKLTLGGSIEYTLTPVWSMGVEYYYLPYKANDINGHYSVNGSMHTADYFMAFNLLKWFYKSSRSKWGLWATLGGGAAYYNATYLTDGSSTVNNQDYKDISDTVKNGWALTVPVGALIEYNVSKSFAIGAKIQYRSYNKDNVDGRNFRGVTNDFLEMATLQLRYKFNAINKNHTRNINLDEFEGTGVDSIKPKLAAVQNKVDSLQKDLAAIKPVVHKNDSIIQDKLPLLNELPNLTHRVQRLEDIICPDGPDTDGDGVPDCRDKEANTPANTPVDFWGRHISLYDPGAAIYFDFDKTNLDSEAERAINYCADKMKSDPNLLVEVRGFTDNMGTNSYNENLSQRRADVVKNELVSVYGIDPSRIIANGKGKYNPEDKTIPFRPYRTCMLLYSQQN